MRRRIVAVWLVACLAVSSAFAAQEIAGGTGGWLDRLKNPATRIDAEWNLRLEKDKAKIPDLISLLKTGEGPLKITVLQILSETGDENLWKEMVVLLKDPDYTVREAAARALGNLGMRQSVPYLMETILEGMDMGNAVTYWAMPSDITENFRYAAVEALNRIAKQNFKYTRSINNFGRIFWMKKIKNWWTLHQAFYSPAYDALPKTWQDLKAEVERFQGSLPRDIVEGTPGGQEFEQVVKELKEDVEAIAETLASASTSASEIKERCADMAKAYVSMEEIFVYTPELEPVKPSWSSLKGKLEAGCKNLDSFLGKK